MGYCKSQFDFNIPYVPQLAKIHRKRSLPSLANLVHLARENARKRQYDVWHSEGKVCHPCFSILFPYFFVFCCTQVIINIGIKVPVIIYCEI